MRLKKPWKIVPFESAVTDTTGGQPKIQKKEYLVSGSLPVIDQGQDLIAGYTDNRDMSYKGSLPVILFGDHTRVFKYVDFPFALGADGVKVLSLINSFHPKFLYFYFQSIKIMSRGYSRHFKFLKEFSIPLFPLTEQCRIVEILDRADALRKKRTEADAKIERILPALFYKMFGDPATNPMGWEMLPLGEVSIGRPQYGANAKTIDWSDGNPRYVRITDIQDDGSLSDEVKTLNMNEWTHYVLEWGDLLFARSGATVGKTYLYQAADGLCAFAGYLIRFKIDASQMDPWVVFAFTQTSHYKRWVSSKRRTVAQPNINGKEYASLLIPKPDRKLQQAFASSAKQLITLRGVMSRAKNKIEKTFSLLLYQAFSGDLTAKWRSAHMKKLLAEMEEQAKIFGLNEKE